MFPERSRRCSRSRLRARAGCRCGRRASAALPPPPSWPSPACHSDLRPTARCFSHLAVGNFLSNNQLDLHILICTTFSNYRCKLVETVPGLQVQDPSGSPTTSKLTRSLRHFGKFGFLMSINVNNRINGARRAVGASGACGSGHAPGEGPRRAAQSAPRPPAASTARAGMGALHRDRAASTPASVTPPPSSTGTLELKETPLGPRLGRRTELSSGRTRRRPRMRTGLRTAWTTSSESRRTRTRTRRRRGRSCERSEREERVAAGIRPPSVTARGVCRKGRRRRGSWPRTRSTIFFNACASPSHQPAVPGRRSRSRRRGSQRWWGAREEALVSEQQELRQACGARARPAAAAEGSDNEDDVKPPPHPN
ncbi:unnamed protein product [Trichogramma brassicae]|uniref:Uncharacterized protein n=1 Tax=Trichogramma brassicae TaxID=86971 RepID=A0A6H5J0A6_9HYME|nr:unnamed protein product [Trichogramma brassicae]